MRYFNGVFMRCFLVIVFFTFSLQATAAYNADFVGVVDAVVVYAYKDDIVFNLKNQADVPHSCSGGHYFSIPASITQNRREAILSRLLTAYATKEPILVGYDKNGECIGAHIQMHRIG